MVRSWTGVTYWTMDTTEDKNQPNVSVILPASGCGERLGNEKPKQYYLVMGKPLICHTIEAFERISWVQRIVVVTAPAYVELMRQIVEDSGYSICEVVIGGSTRHRSIANGIKALSYTGSDMNPDIVVVHDAVRPLVPVDTLKEVILAAKQFGASGAVKQLVSTVVLGDEQGFLEQSLERCRYRASEMPQAFQYNVIKTAYEKCSEHDLDHGTECLMLGLKYAGVKAKLIEGPSELGKVTHKNDLYTVYGSLKETCNHTLIVTDNIQSSLIETLQKTLDQKNSKMAICDSKIREPGDYRDFNNTVFLHFNKRIGDLAKCKDKMELAAECATLRDNSLIKRIVVHVFTYTKEPFPTLHDYPQAFVAAKQMANQSRDPFTCVYIIWTVDQVSADKDQKVADIVINLVKNWNYAMHGQLFVI